MVVFSSECSTADNVPIMRFIDVPFVRHCYWIYEDIELQQIQENSFDELYIHRPCLFSVSILMDTSMKVKQAELKYVILALYHTL